MKCRDVGLSNSFVVRVGGFPGIVWDDCDKEDEEEDNASDAVNVGYKVLDMIVEKYENEHSILKVLFNWCCIY